MVAWGTTVLGKRGLCNNESRRAFQPDRFAEEQYYLQRPDNISA